MSRTSTDAIQNRSHSKSRLLALFLGAATLGAAVAAPSVAQAWWTRTSGMACNDRGGASTSTYTSKNCNNTTDSGRHLFCPVPDADTHPKTAITQFNVHVTESNPNAVAAAMRCVSYRDAVGGKCGALVNTTSSGIQNLQPPTFAEWGWSNTYGYLFVALPKAVVANDACIQGFLTSN